MKKIYDVIIIGGGSAGLFCGAHLNTLETLVLEKMERVGKKLLISGGGQCNYTHTGDLKFFQEKYGNQGKFISHVLKGFSNQELIEYFKVNGVESFVREDGKIFPKSLNSATVVELLKRKNREIRCDEEVIKISHDGQFHIETGSSRFECRHLVIATGGNSYPPLGSSGEGYKFAEMLGHTITPISPALTPIWVKHSPFKSLMGIGLKSVEISIYKNAKILKRHVGDLGFTHFGLSGPAIIDASRYMTSGEKIEVNFIYSHFKNSEVLENFFISEFEKNSKKQIHNFLKILEIPERFLDVILKISEVSSEKKLCEISKTERKKLIITLTQYEIEIEKLGEFSIAMATTGGVNCIEVSPKTLQSKIVENLYFIGEVLDVDGDTGGYNIQFAFSSGYKCAENIMKKERIQGEKNETER